MIPDVRHLADAILPGRTPAGKPIQRKVTGRTKTEVRGKLKWIQAEAEARLRTLRPGSRPAGI